MNVADVNVLANSDPSSRYASGIYMPVQSDAVVRFTSESGIHAALGIDRMPEQSRIPAGLVRMSNGTQARIFLDSRFLLGPEGAHVNISGISGLATKTSYAMFLIQSILQSVRDREIAVLLLNVKQDDLLVIDQPRPDMTDSERDVWRAVGLIAEPFQNVRYLLPWGKQTPTTGHPNSYGLPNSYQIYAYSLLDVVNGPGLEPLIGFQTQTRPSAESLQRSGAA